jgi:hypothetical protein
VKQPEPEHSSYDQIDRDDVIEQPGHNQNENAREERDDWLHMRDGESHGLCAPKAKSRKAIGFSASILHRD